MDVADKENSSSSEKDTDADLSSSSEKDDVVESSCSSKETSSSSSRELAYSSSSGTNLSSSETGTQTSSSSSEPAENSSSSSVLASYSSATEKLKIIDCEGVSKPNWNYLNPEIEFHCIQDVRDLQYYATVKIGTQTWMAENMNYRYVGVAYKYSYYEVISYEDDSTSWCYGGKVSNCDIYGRLYTWEAAMQACPEGWHLPNDMEWRTLWTAVGNTNAIGTKLKSASGWDDCGNGTDSYGFSVLPAGSRGYRGDYYDAGSSGDFWSSSEDGSSRAYYWEFYCNSDDAYHDSRNKIIGFPVRCLQD